MNTMFEKYWIISSPGGLIKSTHKTEREALSECKIFAKNSDGLFIVLEAIAGFQRAQAPVVELVPVVYP